MEVGNLTLRIGNENILVQIVALKRPHLLGRVAYGEDKFAVPRFIFRSSEVVKNKRGGQPMLWQRGMKNFIPNFFVVGVQNTLDHLDREVERCDSEM